MLLVTLFGCLPNASHSTAGHMYNSCCRMQRQHVRFYKRGMFNAPIIKKLPDESGNVPVEPLQKAEVAAEWRYLHILGGNSRL